MNKVKYVRWSSIQQNGNRQLLNESDYDRIYSEQVSGSVHMEKRKEGGRLLADIKAGKVRELCVEEVSRLGRDTIDCMKTLKLCEAMGVNVVIENMGLNSIVDKKPNPIFKMITTILATMAEAEKQNIAERTEMGRIAARNRGVRFGRKEGHKESLMKFLSKPKVQLVLNYLRSDKGYTIREIMKLADVSNTMVMKIKKMGITDNMPKTNRF